MTTPCFIANWKMNKTVAEARAYLNLLQKRLPEIDGQDWDLILAPPYTALAPVFDFIKGSDLPIRLAAQNFYFADEGAYTGEISARMVQEVGCQYIILGHSERRVHFGEKDNEIALKIAAAQIVGLTPILCVGESAEERESGKTLSVIKHQIKKGFNLESSDDGLLDLSDFLIAYEPVWAIGTGKTPIPKEVDSVHQEIVTYLKSVGVASDGMPRIVYGGSVNEKNVGEFMREPHIDGVLVGGGSLSAETFFKMVELGLYAKEAR